MFLTVRLGKLLNLFWLASKYLLGGLVISIFAGMISGGLGLLVFIPIGLYAMWGLTYYTVFYLVCNIEQSRQSVAGNGRLQTELVRESTHHGELAYSKNKTNFQTSESGSFTFQLDGYRELKDGDGIVLRTFRWNPLGKIREYDILDYEYAIQ